MMVNDKLLKIRRALFQITSPEFAWTDWIKLLNPGRKASNPTKMLRGHLLIVTGTIIRLALVITRVISLVDYNIPPHTHLLLYFGLVSPCDPKVTFPRMSFTDRHQKAWDANIQNSVSQMCTFDITATTNSRFHSNNVKDRQALILHYHIHTCARIMLVSTELQAPQSRIYIHTHSSGFHGNYVNERA